VLDFLELVLQVVDFGQQLLPLVLELGRVLQLLGGLHLQFVLHDLELLLFLVEQLGQPFVLAQQLRVLLEDHLHLLLQFDDLLALGLEDGVLLLQHDQVGPQELLYAVGVVVQFGSDIGPAG
jgi:hypothetical protein